MQSDLARFWDGLLPLMGSESDRPFVCDGSPLDCTSFVVGFNPATTLGVPFSTYRMSDHGFDRSRFRGDYLVARAAAGKRVGSGNRPRIEALSDALGSCLETNVYSLPTAKAKQLRASERSVAMFTYLFLNVRPRLLVLHSNVAIQAFADLIGTSLESGELNRAACEGHRFHYYGIDGPLFRRKITWCADLGRELADCVPRS